MAFDRRDQGRLAVHWRVAIQLPNSQEVLHGRTADVSMGGACALFDRDIPMNNACSLFLEVPIFTQQTKQSICIQAKVINSTLVGHISQFRIGFKFIALDADIEALFKTHKI